jgi:hypothetical protein
LRIRLSGEQIRMLYFFCYQKYIVLYYAFVKNVDRVPQQFIQKVAAYRNDFLRRYDARELEDQILEEI